MEQIKKYIVPIMVAALLLSGCAGFAIGRVTAPKAPVTSTEVATVAETTPAAQVAATEAPVEAVTEEVDFSSGVIDAADITSLDDIPHTEEAKDHHLGEAGEASDSEIDPEEALENVTADEAVLPDGVASTLWSKDGHEAMQIVVFGDSQFGNFLGEDGMAYMLSQKAQANVYNLAIGGTSAALRPTSAIDTDNIENQNLYCWMKVLEGDVKIDRFADYVYQSNVYKSCDLSKTDVFILEYGVNDYFQKSPIYSEVGDEHDPYSYAGSIKYAIRTIREKYPKAHIIVCAPTFANFFEMGTGAFLGNYYSLSNGYGKLIEYAEASGNAIGDYGNTIVFTPAYHMDSPIDLYNAADRLIDGVHMSVEMRQLYTDKLAQLCIQQAGYEFSGYDFSSDWKSTKKD